MKKITLVWLRRSLRVEDNPALSAACERAIAGGGAVIPIYIQEPDREGAWPMGGASRWWLHHSLGSLAGSLNGLGSRLILRQGPGLDALEELIEQTGADAVYWDRCYEPAAVKRDAAIESRVVEMGVQVQGFNAGLLYEPWDVETKQGGPYKVFTPFWRTCQQLPAPSRPLSAPASIPAPGRWPKSCKLKELALLSKVDWAGGLRDTWVPGETGAADALEQFLDRAVTTYGEDRDRPDRQGTSRLSPYLHFGEISPRQVWHATTARIRRTMRPAESKSAWHFLREIGWREFGQHLIYHFPNTPDEPLRKEFKRFPWDTNPSGLEAWQRGETGYPIVDAGMRQLWHTGWMHNRVRMIVASFLVKDLLVDWRAGAAWFWDTLVDADLASNTLGWQWAGGCGADAAPYFRVFNPVLQGKKFDPDGAYVRRWVPELKSVETRFIHEPWKAPAPALIGAAESHADAYPGRMVDHAEARDRALEAFETLKKYK